MLTDEERALLAEVDKRSTTNEFKLDALVEDVKELKTDNRAMLKIATSVELIAQRMSHIEEKVDSQNGKLDSTNKKVDDLTSKIDGNESKPLEQTAQNVNTAKMAIVLGVISAIVSAIMTFILK